MYQVTETANFTLVEVKMPPTPIRPEDINRYLVEAPEVDMTKGVIISGRMPIWLACSLVHHYHPALWVATFDPRLGGGIVVMTHIPDVSVGSIIPLK